MVALLSAIQVSCYSDGTQVAENAFPPVIEMRQGDDVINKTVHPGKTGFVIVDAWDNHWCKDLRDRTSARGEKIAPVVESLREAGVTIVWAPAATNSRDDRPEEAAALQRTNALPDYPLPDVSPIPYDPHAFLGSRTKVTCVTGEQSHRFSKHLNKELRVRDGDYWAYTEQKLWNVIQYHSLTTLLYAGFAYNSCVSIRDYGLLQMKAHGMETHLIRDLTDSSFTVIDPPTPNDAILEEWALSAEPVIGPTALSTELLAKF